MLKICFKCNAELSLNCFYKHKDMAAGYLNKCKACAILDAKNRYDNKTEAIRKYEKLRQQKPERRAKKVKYQRAAKIRNPERFQARQMLNNTIRSGKIKRANCFYCNDPETQAHHHDYSKALDVRWVCFRCHRVIEHGQSF